MFNIATVSDFPKRQQNTPTMSSIQERDGLLVHGYIRMMRIGIRIDIPNDIIEIIVAFYMQLFEKLKWNSDYMDPGMELLENDECLFASNRTLLDTTSAGLVDIEPVTSGEHCWRMQLINPERDWILIGVSHMKKIRLWTDDSSYVKFYSRHCSHIGELILFL